MNGIKINKKPLGKRIWEARYLYLLTLMPMASAVAGLSPTERRCRPTLVRNSTQEATTAMMISVGDIEINLLTVFFCMENSENLTYTYL